MSDPHYLPRSPHQCADYVVYLANHAPSLSVWMVPSTHSDDPITPYRSAILAAAKPIRMSKVTHQPMIFEGAH